MNIITKFMNWMKIGDDEIEDEDYPYDDDDDDTDEYDKGKRGRGRRSDERRDSDDEVYSDDAGGRSQRSSERTSKVTPIRQASRRGNMEVCVIKPTTVDDSREITETLLSGSTVILNLEALDLEIAQRIIDFTSGATFAINGKLQRISNYIFLVTPTNVDISGDLQDLLNSSFDVPSIKTRI